jgi:hypothetical protein
MCFTAAQDVELNRHSEYRREIHGNDTDKVSGNHPPGRPEKKDAENEPLRINPEGLLVDCEGVVLGPLIEGSYYMPARVPK